MHSQAVDNSHRFDKGLVHKDKVFVKLLENTTSLKCTNEAKENSAYMHLH